MSQFTNRVEDCKPLTKEALDALLVEIKRQTAHYAAFLRSREEIAAMNNPVSPELWLELRR